ncbi:MAG: CPBP family intramembrane glutamic endopeptidase [Planctomycetaceae bacterium]
MSVPESPSPDAEPNLDDQRVEDSCGWRPDESAAGEILDPPPVSPRVAVERPLIPGPGPFESIAWLLGVILVHLVAVLFAFIVVVLIAAGTSGNTEFLKDPAAMDQLMQENLGVVTGGEQFLFVLAVLLVVGLRLACPPGTLTSPWDRLLNRLGRVAPRASHLAVLVAVVVPVSLACGQLFLVVDQAWRHLVELIPGLPKVQSVQEVNVIGALAEDLSLGGLVFVLAVLPAIGEELVFRGVIGRGLVARFGVVPGVLVTSMLFALVHVHPAHALSVFPLGVLLHVLYLSSRSILAPILLHFLINGWAAVVTKLGEQMGMGSLEATQVILWPVLLTAVVASVCAVVFFWRSRIEFQLADGRWWWPAYRSVECPHEAATIRRLSPPRSLVAAVCMSLLAFYLTVGLEMSRQVVGGQ